MVLGRPKAELVLSDEQWHALAHWARRPKSSQPLALRSRIVLACGAGQMNQQVAKEMGGAARRLWENGEGGS